MAFSDIVESVHSLLRTRLEDEINYEQNWPLSLSSFPSLPSGLCQMAGVGQMIAHGSNRNLFAFNFSLRKPFPSTFKQQSLVEKGAFYRPVDNKKTENDDMSLFKMSVSHYLHKNTVRSNALFVHLAISKPKSKLQNAWKVYIYYCLSK